MQENTSCDTTAQASDTAKTFQKLTSGRGQRADVLPGAWRCFTEAEVEGIVSDALRTCEPATPSTDCGCIQCDLANLHQHITRIALKSIPAIADKLSTVAVLITRLMLHGAGADFRIVDQVEEGYDSSANLRARNAQSGGAE